MTPAEAESIVMALPQETREAIAVFVEEAGERFHWTEPEEVDPSKVAWELREGEAYRYVPTPYVRPTDPILQILDDWVRERFPRQMAARAEEHAQYIKMLDQKAEGTAGPVAINWSVKVPETPPDAKEMLRFLKR